jgi:cytochrome c peroxidase
MKTGVGEHGERRSVLLHLAGVLPMNPWRWTMRLARFAFAGAVLGVLAVTAASAMDALPKSPPMPADNPTTPAKVELGKQLFFDPRISFTGTVSCNSCHNVMEAGEDDRPVSHGIGGKLGTRSAPTVWNAAFLSVQFWDGRARSLEEQAKGPMVNAVEMGMPDHATVLKRIAAVPGYRAAFDAVFGGDNPVTIDNVAKAIAAYERTLITPNSPFDRYKAGDKQALGADAVRGMKLTESLGCVTCHSGPIFAGPALPEGQGFFMKFPTVAGSEYEAKYHLIDDTGRHTVTRNDDDKHFWRVPQLRNIAITAPYFHNGAVPTLDEAVRVMAKTQLGRDLKPAEVTDLVAFLEGLTGEFPEQTMPRLPVMPQRSLVQD